MIHFHYNTAFRISDESNYKIWLLNIAESEGFHVADLSYAFVSDDELHQMNLHFLNHDTLTDVIGFDNTVGKNLQGDIAISIDRVTENAKSFKVSFDKELQRVMAHGLLHFCGYNDKTPKEKSIMLAKEEEKLEMFHVKQNTETNV